MKLRPIVVVDDDTDDIDLIKGALSMLNVDMPLVSFENPIEAIEYLKKSDNPPFVILCDVNMPFINGFEFRRMIESDRALKLKSIPFLFLSTAADKINVERAFGLSIQGYFRKPISEIETMKMMKDIISYWEKSCRPNQLANSN